MVSQGSVGGLPPGIHSLKQFLDQFLTIYFRVSSNLIHDTAQSANPERFMLGNGNRGR